MASGTATVTLPTDEEILITREFDAPPELVYKAWTTPELVRRWWPGKRGEMQTVEIDLRVGGTWRYVMTATGGFEVAFHGEFLEIAENERLVHTEVFEGAPPPPEPAVTTVTFAAEGDRTRMELRMRVDSIHTRDAIIDSGMEGGMQESYDLLDELVGTLG